MPAKAGIQLLIWIPAFAGMTTFCLFRAYSGVTAWLAGTTGTKKAANAAGAGVLALAAFVSRPQAEAQIGANKTKLY
ncbi:MAG: hypothetical protein ACM3NI_07480 [Bacteroidota bacterium]